MALTVLLSLIFGFQTYSREPEQRLPRGFHHRWQVHRSIREKWAVPMDGAIKHSLISAYFLTAQSYKRMCLTTRVYSNHTGG